MINNNNNNFNIGTSQYSLQHIVKKIKIKIAFTHFSGRN